jgi:hypothetical protein
MYILLKIISRARVEIKLKTSDIRWKHHPDLLRLHASSKSRQVPGIQLQEDYFGIPVEIDSILLPSSSAS